MRNHLTLPGAKHLLISLQNNIEAEFSRAIEV